MKTRHKARVIVVQTLYSLDLKGTLRDSKIGVPFEGLTEDELNSMETELVLYARYLLDGTIEHLVEEDEMINRFSTHRNVEHVDVLDRNILRLSIFSLLYCKDIHPHIIIDEAVKLSREYSNENAYRFINGILDSTVRFLSDSIKK